MSIHTMLLNHLAFIGLFVGTTVFFSWLDVVNVLHGERMLAQRSAWVRERFAVEDPWEIADYDRATTGVNLLQTTTTMLVVLGTLYSGLFTDIVTALQATTLSPLAQGAVLFAGAFAALTLIQKPFDAYATFVVEELFDFNQQTPALFVRDTVVSLLLTTAIAGGLSAALLSIIQSFPNLWALGGIALFVAFMLVFQIVYPRIIAPLFNDFDPIDSGDLREAVDDVFDRAGFELSQLYEMDASRRSSKSNAYFIGFGRTKRVVLFDTLVEQMTREELQAVLAHELAHWQKKHVWKLMAASILQIGIVLAIAQYLTSTEWLYAMFNVPTTATYAGLALALLWLYPLMQLLSPLTNKISLRFEREADDFGATIAGVDAMVSSLQTLGGENLSNPFPHPLYETFHYDHPPIPERIRRLEDSNSPPSSQDDEDATPV